MESDAVLVVQVITAVEVAGLATTVEMTGGLTTGGGGGTRETVLVAETPVEPVALTVTVDAAEMVTGAVYSPELEMAPVAGLRDQVTAVLVVPETVAVN